MAANTAAGLGNPPGSTAFRCGVLELPLPPTSWLEDAVSMAPGTGKATITVQTSQQTVEGIADDVQILLETGVLPHGLANALMVKLNAATSSLNLGKKNAVCGQLGAFVNQVQALQSSGQLTVAQATALINAAQALRTKLGCS